MTSPDKKKYLLNELIKIQEKQGFISKPALETFAQKENISPAELFGFVTFFNSFRVQPTGKIHISICYGTACYIRGAKLIYERLVDEFKLNQQGSSPDGLLTVETVYCVGSCSCAPVIVYEDEQMGHMNIQRSLELVRELIKQATIPQADTRPE